MSVFKIRQLLKEIQDGIELVFVAEDDSLQKILDILKGKGGELPLKIKIKIDEDEKKS